MIISGGVEGSRMQKLTWALIIVSSVTGVYWLANPTASRCEFKADYQTKSYSQTKLDETGRLHKVTKTFFSEKDNASRLIEMP